MELSKNAFYLLDKALYLYPYILKPELKRYIYDAFVKTKKAKSFDCNFHGSVEHALANGLFLSSDAEKVKLWQYHQDLKGHVHIDGLGIRKSNYLSASFTLAYEVIKMFNCEYPNYILVAQILAQVEESAAPEPIKKFDAGARVSFYFYNPCSDGNDLNWYKSLPEYCNKTIYWRFSTFDIPLLEWMIAKAKYENKARKNAKRRERAKEMKLKP